ncbi:coproporphyrinogen dehydrogenase HemZ [[Clostridium] colinum]|uniref:coproporphyrinogen dehydrogenase HemZ n=1 Tax=[Clostridium] colinum TaxID=36835 RepID=UPI00202555CD|nr:coproporphyrinogen dehydrogenase HemZ [[Clostridium] colinum]
MYYIVEHKYQDEVLSIIQLFYFGEKIIKIDSILDDNITIKSSIINDKTTCEIYKDKKQIVYKENSLKDIDEDTFSNEKARLVKLTVFQAIQQIRFLDMPWGILTGVRPTKKINEMLEEGYSKQHIKDILKEKYLATDEKIDLALDIAIIEKNILKNNNKNKISIYLGIPFCPTRCVYCSFTSFNLSQYNKKIDLYLDCLEKEIIAMKEYVNSYEIESIYIGGGTPSSLNEEQFYRFLKMIDDNFNKPLIEYTIEAGRADTITRQKLKAMKDFKATRISINPQTMNDKTLKIIGRNHLEKDFLDAFYMAREEGHNNINTDVILGLTNETSKDVLYTMDKILELIPESLTVHTLALKRASKLNENIDKFNPSSFYEMEEMINITKKYAKKMNMHPYYMYRQKNMIGNFENVGYCKDGLECFYNIQIMEEKQTIISFGAGATSKFYFEDKNLIKRAFNVKSVDEYINRIDEMIKRKIEIIEGEI